MGRRAGVNSFNKPFNEPSGTVPSGSLVLLHRTRLRAR